jgi:hypothetical protein
MKKLTIITLLSLCLAASSLAGAPHVISIRSASLVSVIWLTDGTTWVASAGEATEAFQSAMIEWSDINVSLDDDHIWLASFYDNQKREHRIFVRRVVNGHMKE